MTREEVEAEQRGQFRTNPNVTFERGVPASGKTDIYKEAEKSLRKR